MPTAKEPLVKKLTAKKNCRHVASCQEGCQAKEAKEESCQDANSQGTAC